MSNIKKAVIVAAGLSSRLFPLTLKTPKGLLEVAGEMLLKRSVRLLRDKGIQDILIVVGSKREMIQSALGPHIKYRFNPFFAETNNMGSLWYAKEWIKDEPFIYLHGDIVYAPELLDEFIEESYSDAALLVDFGPSDEEAMKVRVDNGCFLIDSNKEIPLDKADGEWVGMATFPQPQALFRKIENLLEQKHFQVYDTFAFTEMVSEGERFITIPTKGHPWMEIDDESDLNSARKLFP